MACRIPTHPLSGLDLPSQEATTKRRALSPAELAALIEAAESSSKPFRTVAGPDRAVLYLVAVATGYRAGELAALKPSNFELDADPPVARLPGELTKNGQDAVQPIPPAVAARLRTYLATKPVGQPVWPGSWPDRCAVMLQTDLAAAGIPIEVDGAEAVFHSLRHTHVTLLINSGAPAQVTQQNARHSTPVLTIGRYAHTNLADRAEAVGKLPLPGAEVVASPFATLNRADLERTAEALLLGLLASFLTPILTPNREPDRESVEPTGTVAGEKASARKRRKPQES